MEKKVGAYFFGGHADKKIIPVSVPLRLRVPLVVPAEDGFNPFDILDANPRATAARKLVWYRLHEYAIEGPALEHRYARVYIAEDTWPPGYFEDVRAVFRWPEGAIHDHQPRSLAVG